jgi:hypothetical protein
MDDFFIIFIIHYFTSSILTVFAQSGVSPSPVRAITTFIPRGAVSGHGV